MSKNEKDPRQEYMRRIADAWRDQPQDDQRDADETAATDATVFYADANGVTFFMDHATIAEGLKKAKAARTSATTNTPDEDPRLIYMRKMSSMA